MPSVSGGSVVWDLDVDKAKLSAGLADARSEVTKTSQQINSSFETVQDSTKSMGESFTDFANSAVVGATAITGALALIGKSALDSASQFQVARISFNTMIGDSKLAGEELSKLSDFAAKTPFTLPEVLQGAKSLMAMGSSTTDLIPELKALGDVSAGLDVPMSRLIQNFGQVRTAGKLTGRELRDFNLAGVPLIDELVKQMNAQGGALTKVGGTSAKTKTKIDALNDSLAKQTNRLDEMNKKGNKSSAAYKNLNIDIDNTKEKLAGLGPVTDGVSKRIKVTKTDIADMVSAGSISFDMVKKAFMSMTGEGGKFNNLMDNLSQTFQGRMSNISDNMTRLSAAFMGVSTSGDVLAGGLFDRISTGAQKVLDVLNEITPRAQEFMQNLLNNGPAVAAILGGLVGLLVPLAIAFATLIAPALAFAAAGAAIGFMIQLLVEKMGGWAVVQAAMMQAWGDFVKIYNGAIKPALDGLWQTIQTQLIPPLQQLWTEISPILIPALKILGEILGGFLLGSFLVIIEVIRQTVIWVGDMITAFNQFVEFCKGLPAQISAAFAGLKDAIVKPFTDAWNEIQKIADNIKAQMDKISPFHRNSPSLVDKVTSGVDIIKQQFSSLGDLSFPKVSQTAVPGGDAGFFNKGFGGGGGDTKNISSQPNITVNIGTVQSKSDVDMINREIGFRASLLPAQ